MIHELSFKFHWTRWIWLFKYRQRGFCVEEGRLFMKMDPEEDYQFIIPAWEIFWNTIPCYVPLTKMIQDFRIDYYFTRLTVICLDHLDIPAYSNKTYWISDQTYVREMIVVKKESNKRIWIKFMKIHLKLNQTKYQIL